MWLCFCWHKHAAAAEAPPHTACNALDLISVLYFVDQFVQRQFDAISLAGTVNDICHGVFHKSLVMTGLTVSQDQRIMWQYKRNRSLSEDKQLIEKLTVSLIAVFF